ncbi:MAG: RagB/SusD family nutrient uptake outer membrane protein [Chitinophagaceae bacterium]
MFIYKVKTYLLCGTLLLCAASVTSCKKMVEADIYSSLSDGNAFETEDDAIAAVNAVYGKLKAPYASDSWKYYSGTQLLLGDFTTDMCHSRSTSGSMLQLTQCNWSASNDIFADGWQYTYAMITVANNAIYNINNMETISDDAKHQFLSELKFLRALGYMDLTDEYGPVILVDESNIENPDPLGQPDTTSVDSITNFVLSDLNYALTYLPTDYSSSDYYESTDVGRATQGAVLALMCRTYIREKQWQKVADLTAQIISLGKYSLYDSYSDLFKEATIFTDENIFSVLSNSSSNGTELKNETGPMKHQVVTDRWQLWSAAWYFWNTFETEDDRREMFFYDYIGTDSKHYIQAPDGETSAPSGYYYLPDVASTKFADPTGPDNYLDGNSYPVFRYAEVLLWRAEALNELNGPNSESIELVNQVKNRSNAILLSTNTDAFNQTSLRDSILQERGWEFFLEGKRRADLIRMDRYEEYTNAYLSSIGLTYTVTLSKNKYFPYPQDQVDLNPNLSNSGRL